VCAITSLTAAQARPAGLARIMRGHRGIEDRLHRLPARYITRRDQVPNDYRAISAVISSPLWGVSHVALRTFRAA